MAGLWGNRGSTGGRIPARWSAGGEGKQEDEQDEVAVNVWVAVGHEMVVRGGGPWRGRPAVCLLLRGDAPAKGGGRGRSWELAWEVDYAAGWSIWKEGVPS